jgi:urocanate hydratase
MLVQGTSQATTSGTSITFTGIPSWAKRITMSLNGVSTSGTSAVQVQLGSGSATTSGYAGLYTALGGPSVFSANVTSGLVLNTATGDTASALRNGIITFTNLTGNSWVGTGTIGVTNATYGCVASTAITLSGILDRIILTTVNGTDTFDAGSVNIQYE